MQQSNRELTIFCKITTNTNVTTIFKYHKRLFFIHRYSRI